MSGEYRIRASKQSVWDALNDPETLRASIPGCQTVDKVSDSEMTATVVAKVGPVKATFKGKVTLSDLDPPHSYTITGEGQGGPVGFGKGSAKVSLAEEGEKTVLSYTASAQVGGKLAQIGQRLIDSTAKSMASQFFAAFAEIVGRPAAEVAPEEVAGAPEPAPPAIAPPRAKGVSTQTWVIAIVVVVVILLLVFAGGE